ncbi:hypothetical protein ACFQ3S_09010 [Mucilaginibacter terrae]|uniref:hypothetical protein n=1 Tax=Mucilaginibacter terrae TaxID=1955052 RepID=UPI003644256C
MKNGETSKSYYLSPWRSITIGIILIIVGLAFTFMGVDIKDSFWDNLQWVLVSFQGIVEFLTSLLMLAFKLGFLLGGYFFIKYADGVERARLDDEGLYYREIPKGSGASKLAMDAGPLTFAAYKTIRDITLKKTFWAGWQLYLTLDSGVQPLTALGVLKQVEKQEILEKVKQSIRLNL